MLIILLSIILILTIIGTCNCTHVHQTESAEFVPDVSTRDRIIAKLQSIFYVRIRIDFIVSFEIATLPIRYENIVDY